MQRLKAFILSILVTTLFMFGVVALFNHQISSYLLSRQTVKLTDLSAKQIQKNQEKKADFDFSKVQPLDFKNILAHQFDHNLPVIGAITIPDVNLELPIFNGVGGGNLWHGAGTLKENQVMGQGNYALAGHNMTGFSNDTSLLFTPLTRVKEGMSIYLLDQKNQYQYQVDSIQIINPDQGNVILDHQNKKELTLVTCAEAEATHRIIVHATFQEECHQTNKN